MVKVPKGYRSRNVKRNSGGGSGGGFGFGRRSSSGGGSLGGGGGLGSGGLGGALGGAGASSVGRRKGCGGVTGLVVLVVFGILLFACLGSSPGGVLDSGGDGLTSGSNGVDAGSSNSGSTDSGDSCAGNSGAILDACELANFVLDDVQDNFWVDEYPRVFGVGYQFSELNLFSNNVSTGGCGTASSSVGPFYCPADGNAYIDLQFMLQLQQQLGAEGDFAQAYILAHEIGHHVQNLAGINASVRSQQSQAGSQAEANALLVMLELQADCFAGAWAADADARGNILDEGDLNEGVRAAGSVGDDAITGSTNQENFTHGSSAQRIEWFERGFFDGTEGCGTFGGSLFPQ